MNFSVEWFDYANFYKGIIERFKAGAAFVEVGCWEGRSSTYLLREIIANQYPIKVDFVDTWLGDVNVPYQQDLIREQGRDYIYNRFCKNVNEVDPFGLALGNIFRRDSVEGSEWYENKSLDFVFIDADHSYAAVKADIEAWLPKIKSGGVLAGHDYDFPDVRKAVNEAFGDLPEIEGHVWSYDVK